MTVPAVWVRDMLPLKKSDNKHQNDVISRCYLQIHWRYESLTTGIGSCLACLLRWIIPLFTILSHGDCGAHMRQETYFLLDTHAQGELSHVVHVCNRGALFFGAHM